MQRIDNRHETASPHIRPDERVLRTLLEMISKHDLDYSSFCVAAENEPAITSRIMRAARAILAGRENGVERLRHAIAIIGLRRVQDILETVGRDVGVIESQD